MSRRPGQFEKRIHEVDFVRGLMMMLVIMDHIFWSFKGYNNTWFERTGLEFFEGVYHFFNFYWTSVARTIIRQIVLFGFVFVSGISCAFSRNNWKRAGIMLLVYFALKIVTNVMQGMFPDGTQAFIIDINVIGVLAWSCLIYCFVQNKSWKMSAALGLIFFVFTIVVIPALLAIPNMANTYVPELWAPTFKVGDWMPLFPYICYFFLGAVVTRFVYPTKQSLFEKRYDFERPFCFVGRHAMWVYLGHEPLLIIIFALLSLIITGSF